MQKIISLSLVLSLVVAMFAGCSKPMPIDAGATSNQVTEQTSSDTVTALNPSIENTTFQTLDLEKEASNANHSSDWGIDFDDVKIYLPILYNDFVDKTGYSVISVVDQHTLEENLKPNNGVDLVLKKDSSEIAITLTNLSNIDKPVSDCYITEVSDAKYYNSGKNKQGFKIANMGINEKVSKKDLKNTFDDVFGDVSGAGTTIKCGKVYSVIYAVRIVGEKIEFVNVVVKWRQN